MRDKPDFYAEKAKREGYLARSVYKLTEIQEKHNVLSRGDAVLDLGAAPGSWTQRALEIVGEKGRVCAVDLSPLSFEPKNGKNQGDLTMHAMDIFSDELETHIGPTGPFDVVLSDAAPATSGTRGLDAARSAALVERCLQICETQLKPGGNIAVKLFQGSDEQQLRGEMQQLFRKAVTAKPKACRKDSFEIYLVGIGYQGGAAGERGMQNGQ